MKFQYWYELFQDIGINTLIIFGIARSAMEALALVSDSEGKVFRPPEK